MSTRKPKVLAGFAGALSAPEVAWSLVDAGFEVMFFAKRGRASAVCHSRHTVVREITPPEEDSAAALSELTALIASAPADEPHVLLPLDDASVWLCDQVRLPAQWVLAGPQGDATSLALDKAKQVALAEVAGFRVPETVLATELSELPADVEFPVIVRPASAVVVEDTRLGKGGNWICSNRVELEKAFAAGAGKGKLLVQEYIQGSGEGVFGLAGENGVMALSAHRRLRMMNPHGSGSSACASRPVPGETRASVEKFIQHSGWRGIFMIELLQDRAGAHWFIEFNGRAWGSMALARRQGFEYPAWAVELALDPQFVPAKVKESTEEIECRNLGRDLMHLLFVLRGAKTKVIEAWPSFWKAIAEQLCWRRGTAWYNWRRDDRRVFLADSFYTVRDQIFKARS
jgi:predicted ATP-grasp superfamily ATP-dependent carboligase